MKAGNLIHRVTLQRETVTNTNGEESSSWTDIGTYWAFVKPISGGETISFQQVRADRQSQVTMRYVGEINAGDRLLFKSRTLEIVAPINVDEKNVELTVLCKERHA